MFERICVVGAGGWGTALAMVLAESGADVSLWSHNADVAAELAAERTNEAYLPGVRVPGNVRATTALDEAVARAGLIVVVTPSKATRAVARGLQAAGVAEDAVVVSCTKGLEHETGKLMSAVIADELPGRRMAVLSGPNLAGEIARGVPAAGVVGSTEVELLPGLQEVFSTRTFRAYTSDDVAGIQLGGALKNVFAIAAGVSDGFGMGDNAKAALVTRALAEMMRLGVTLGGRRETFAGLSGVGDLMVTCFSKSSRNRGFGERLGRGEAAARILDSMKMVAEGVPTTRSVWQVAKRLGVEAPVTEQVFAVLEGKCAREAMGELLGRAPKAEVG
jgi:glycerol-3-phosphate dehydrogenase (NAD(P)+)